CLLGNVVLLRHVVNRFWKNIIGSCKAARYYDNSSSMSCELFMSGGCLGNRNNFENERVCLQTCRETGRGMEYETHLHIG
uniref:BPTI/Kunitz inhibitor domain-containing protein n=1 Tax=Cyclopterus lumpus TaxID=8103 RepID=A0A8C2WVR2_CYCLU